MDLRGKEADVKLSDDFFDRIRVCAGDARRCAGATPRAVDRLDALAEAASQEQERRERARV